MGRRCCRCEPWNDNARSTARILLGVEFESALADLGFTRTRAPVSGGEVRYESHPNRYLTYWVHAFRDGTALFTFEFAIAEYVSRLGLQIGSNEELNQFLYPQSDVKGNQDGAWLAAAIEYAETLLASVHLADPDEGGDRPQG